MQQIAPLREIIRPSEFDDKMHEKSREEKSEQAFTYHRRAVCPAEVIFKHLIVESDPLVVMSKACDNRMKHCLKSWKSSLFGHPSLARKRGETSRVLPVHRKG